MESIVKVKDKEQLFEIVENLKVRQYSDEDIDRIINGENIVEVFFDRVYIHIINLPNCYKKYFELKSKEDFKKYLGIKHFRNAKPIIALKLKFIFRYEKKKNKTEEDYKNILNIKNDIQELELIWNEQIEKIQVGSKIKENLKNEKINIK